jgi:putative endonuclease
MRKDQSYVYMLTNERNTVFYTGATSDLVRRTYEHKMHKGSGFTSKYRITKLVYFEIFNDITQAITREKQLKSGSRNKKIQLIQKDNPAFRDLYSAIA